MSGKLRYVAPNAITSLSLVFALSSIFCALSGAFEWAGWLILWCVLMDKADGFVARLLNASSTFGMELDSLVDLVAFGVAPGVLAFAALTGGPGGESSPFTVAPTVCLYVICVSLRLALFNSTEEAPEADAFRGIPSTLGGAILASGFLTALSFELSPDGVRLGLTSGLIVLGMLMISPWPLPKIKTRQQPLFNVMQGSLIGASYIAGFLRVFPEILFVEAAGYLVVGMTIGGRRVQAPGKRSRDEDERGEDEELTPVADAEETTR